MKMNVFTMNHALYLLILALNENECIYFIYINSYLEKAIFQAPLTILVNTCFKWIHC